MSAKSVEPNLFKNAELVAAATSMTAKQLGEYSKILNKVAQNFGQVGNKRVAADLKKIARGYNKAAGKRGMGE